MSKIFFRWHNFSVKFLNAVLQSSKTPAGTVNSFAQISSDILAEV